MILGASGHTVLRGICLFVFKVFWDISAEILTQSVRAGAQRSAFILFFYILRMSLHHAFFFLLGRSVHQLDETSVYGNPEFLHIYFIEKLSGKQKCQLEHVFLPENFSISACYIRNENKTPNLSLGGRLGRFLHRKTAVKALCSLDVITTFP